MNIFISYSWKDKELVNVIDKFFFDNKIILVRDERDLAYTKSINEFMDSIRKNDYFIIALSKDYFKSINCIKELKNALKEVEFQTKVLPIVLDSGFGSPLYIKEVILHWMTEEKEIREILDGLDPLDTIELSKNLRDIVRIKLEVAEMIRIFSSMLYVNYENEVEKNFETLISKIKKPYDDLSLQIENKVKSGDVKEVFLDSLTIGHLKNYITGDTNKVKYMSGPNLVEFFNNFGRNDFYAQGFPSRWFYTENCLNELNGTKEMKKIIEKIVDKRNFFQSGYSHELVLKELNEILEFDGYFIKQEGINLKVFKILD